MHAMDNIKALIEVYELNIAFIPTILLKLVVNSQIDNIKVGTSSL